MARICSLCMVLLLTNSAGLSTGRLLDHGEVQSAPVTAGRAKAASAVEAGLAPIFGRIWRITKAPSQLPAGSIYIFLSNGTLLETSCVETYRVATWTADTKAPRILHVLEDKRPAFTATIKELTPTTLILEQRFSHGNQEHVLTLTAIDGEYVCPDMPK
jgi:hypothetical protein